LGITCSQRPFIAPERASFPSGAGFFSGHIIAILAAILFPVFARAKEKANQAACLSNGKQLGTALMMYIQDYDELLPYSYFEYGTYLFSVLYPYTKNDKFLACPSAKLRYWDYRPGWGNVADWPDGNWAYLDNGWGIDQYHYPYRSIYSTNFTSLAQVNRPAEAGVFFERSGALTSMPYVYCPTDLTPAWLSWYAQISKRHNGGSNVVYYDGHAKWQSYSGLTDLGPQGRILWVHDNPQ